MACASPASCHDVFFHCARKVYVLWCQSGQVCLCLAISLFNNISPSQITELNYRDGRDTRSLVPEDDCTQAADYTITTFKVSTVYATFVACETSTVHGTYYDSLVAGGLHCRTQD